MQGGLFKLFPCLVNIREIFLTIPPKVKCGHAAQECSTCHESQAGGANANTKSLNNAAWRIVER